jgi:Flp pilus assembly protein TadG
VTEHGWHEAVTTSTPRRHRSGARVDLQLHPQTQTQGMSLRSRNISYAPSTTQHRGRPSDGSGNRTGQRASVTARRSIFCPSGHIARRDNRGAAAVEFALVMLPLLYLIFGIVQYGMYFYATQTGTSAVGEAVRRLTVGSCQDSSQLEQFLASRLGAASTDSATDLDTTVTYMDGSSPPAPTSAPGVVGGSVTLTLSFDALNMHFPFIPLPNNGQVTRSEFGRVEDTTSLTNGCV